MFTIRIAVLPSCGALKFTVNASVAGLGTNSTLTDEFAFILGTPTLPALFSSKRLLPCDAVSEVTAKSY